MKSVLVVNNLTKTYPSFQLKNVSFCLEPGKIMGFIGRNGAGKTTTIKSMLNLVRPDGGSVQFFGLDMNAHEMEIKQRMAFIFGAANYYAQSKIKTITSVYRRFYRQWDEPLYQSHLQRFGLDPEKRIKQLSQGMSIKYALALALSHHAELLILDEPTSGLDPVSRDELLTIFEDIVDQEGVSIFFSTHITSDLDKNADEITYIKDGEIVTSQPKDSLISAYRMVEGDASLLPEALKAHLIGYHERKGQFSGMARAADAREIPGLRIQPADLESIMVCTERQ